MYSTLSHHINRHRHSSRLMEHKIKTILVDLSGTLHIENEEIPGSVEALKRQDMEIESFNLDRSTEGLF